MSNPILENLSKFENTKEKSKEILNSIAKSVAVVDQNHSLIKDCSLAIEKMNSSKMIISVVGEFSSGKSCFLNSLLGEEILSESPDQNTATVNFLEYADNPKMVVKFRHELNLPDEIIENVEPTEFKKYIEEYTSELSDKFKDKEKKVSEMIDRVICYYPSLILKEGITIVDTPGINGLIPGHTEITQEQIKKSHAAIGVLTCEAVGGGETEMKFLRDVKEEILGDSKNEADKLMYLANKMYLAQTSVDNGQSKGRSFLQQTDHFLNKFKDSIEKYVGIEKDKINIFAYDSKWAISKDSSEKEKSGFSEVTQHIDEILTSDKKIMSSKFLSPMNDIEKILGRTKKLLEDRKNEFSNTQTLEEIEEKIQESTENEKNLIRRLEIENQALKHDLNDVKENLQSSFENKIIDKIDTFLIEQVSEIQNISSENDIKKVIDETNKFFDEFKIDFSKFIESDIRRELQSKIDNYKHVIENDIKNIFSTNILDELKEKIEDKISLSLELEEVFSIESFIANQEARNKYLADIDSYQEKIELLEGDKGIVDINREVIDKKIKNLQDEVLEATRKNALLGPPPPPEKDPVKYHAYRPWGSIWGTLANVFAGQYQDTKMELNWENHNLHQNMIKANNDQISSLKKDIEDLEKKLISEAKNDNDIKSKLRRLENTLKNQEKKETELINNEHQFWIKTKDRIQKHLNIRFKSIKKQIELLKLNVIDKMIVEVAEQLSNNTTIIIKDQLTNLSSELERLRTDKNKNESEIKANIERVEKALSELGDIEIKFVNHKKSIEKLINK